MMFALCLTMAVQAQSSCVTPTNLTATDITENSATVSWTGNTEQYNVLYGTGNYYYCGFDVEGIDGWSIVDNDGDGNKWKVSSEGRSGFALFSISWKRVALNPDDWLISPTVDLGGTMSVWMKSGNINDLDTFAIYLTTDPNWSSAANLTDVFNTILVDKTGAPSEYTKYTADLSAYAGQQGYIAIRHFCSYDRNALYVDDFSVGECTLLSGVSSPVDLTGLDPETTYKVQVQGICEDGSTTEWSEVLEFTTTECVISEINIEGFTAPEWGAHPDNDVYVEDTRYTLDYASWNWDDGDYAGILGVTETFNNEDYVYYMYFEVLPIDGCNFAEDVTFKVNGETGSIETSGLSDNGYYWAYTYDYSVTEPTPPDIQSTANWYGYAVYYDLSTQHFITFSMQDISSVDVATTNVPSDYITAACYFNGYVWWIDDSKNLFQAEVDNTNHTIGTFETVASNFVPYHLNSMSYNPADGKIYAINNSGYLSFDPLDPAGTVSNLIELNINAATLAINKEGEAYCIENWSGDLYRLDLSDGSATRVGNTGQNVYSYFQDMAFDMNTGELFWAQLYSTNVYGMYKVNPANAATTYLGQVANGNVIEITGLFMVYDEQPVACNKPYHPKATPAATTAAISWTERGEATQWVVAYKADGETDFTEVTVNETNYTQTGLTPETHYTVKVRPVCEDGTLKWSSVFFTTHGLCDDPSGLEASNVTGTTATLEWTGYQENYTVKYIMPAEIDTILFEDFENGMPADWTTIDADGDGYNWYDLDCSEFDVNPAHSGTGIATSESYANNTPLTPDNWLITPQIELGGTMRVWIGGQDPGYPDEHFAIYLSTAGNTVADFTIPLVTETIATYENVEYTADLSAYAGQQGYIAIRHFHVTDMFRLNVDDFGVFVEPWTTVTASGNSVNLTGLDPETTYQVQVQGVCEDAVTEWSEPVEFTTTEETEPVEPIEPIECGPAEDCDGHSYPTVKIGDVCWMQKNLAAVSCVTSGNVYSYVNDLFPDEAANVATYGLLYDEEAVMQGIGSGAKAAATTGICPTGYRLPTVAEIEALGAAYSADELKSTDHWITGGAGSDLSGFSWLPGGCYSSSKDNFESMLLEGYLWATEEVGGVVSPAMYKITYYCSTILMRVEDHTGLSASVRCVKSFTCGTSKMTDADGNEYETVKIGTQCWTKSNLRVAPAGATNETSSGATSSTEPYYYVNPSVDAATYGYYYNWEAAKLVCPAGWRLPSDAEWTTLTDYVSNVMHGSDYLYRCDPTDPMSIAKALASTVGWNTPGGTCTMGNDPSANNATGFGVVPAGYRDSHFRYAGLLAYFWSSTEYDSNNAYFSDFSSYRVYVQQGYNIKSNGFSVRCVKD